MFTGKSKKPETMNDKRLEDQDMKAVNMIQLYLDAKSMHNAVDGVRL